MNNFLQINFGGPKSPSYFVLNNKERGGLRLVLATLASERNVVEMEGVKMRGILM